MTEDGRPIRIRSVARGTSNYKYIRHISNTSILYYTYIPRVLECFKVNKGSCDSFVGQDRLVLFEQSITGFGIFAFKNCIFKVCFFEGVQRYDDAEDLSERILEISFRSRICELDFLVRSH